MTLDLIATSKAAQRLGVSHSTALRMARSGDLPAAVVVDGRYLFDPEVVDRVREERLRESPSSHPTPSDVPQES